MAYVCVCVAQLKRMCSLPCAKRKVSPIVLGVWMIVRCCCCLYFDDLFSPDSWRDPINVHTAVTVIQQQRWQ